MAETFQPPRIIAQSVVLGGVVLGLGPLFWFAVSRGGLQTLQFDNGIFDVLLFTLKQAGLSTLLSVLPGMLVARALARQDFWGHAWLLRLLAIPSALPAIVVVIALSSIYGRSHLLGDWFNLYGINGILLAHVFFNLPLATRLFYEASETIPPENFRLAAELSFNDFQVFRHVEWPVFRNILPRISALIFLLCAASFAIVLTLGGPTATTLEVAIYQSLRLDFDIGRALCLSLLQVILCLGLVFLSGRMMLQNITHATSHLFQRRFDGRDLVSRSADLTIIFLATILVVPPLGALVINGVAQIHFGLPLFQALLTSFVIGTLTAITTIFIAWPMAQTETWLSQSTALAALIVPPAVMATGWFLLLENLSENTVFVYATIVFLNLLMALPFSAAILAPAFAREAKMHRNLCRELGVSGWNKFRRIDLPMLRRPLIQAILLAFILSFGDLTAITLLGNQGIVTLPSLIQLQMGNYRQNDAAGTALILALLSFSFAWMAQYLGSADD